MNESNPGVGAFFKWVSFVLWGWVVLLCILIFFFRTQVLDWRVDGLVRINALTLVIWVAVAFFSAVVSSFAARYLIGFRYYNRFILLSLGFSLSVSLMVFADAVVLLLVAWLAMGMFMSRLIGIDRRWGEAREAASYCQRYFSCGGLLLSVGMLLLCFYADAYTLTGLLGRLPGLPVWVLLVAALCIIGAAAIQSAMFPFHRWLLSAMTAPTPASALMHAGFVNAAGILLTLLAPLFYQSDTMTLLFIIGGVTAIVAQFAKLIQVNIKQKLGCSTIAQMAFMIMQCGLGFFNAAVVHLILHGFYKAYLFLSSGEAIEQHTEGRKASDGRVGFGKAALICFLGGLGAVAFAWITGKGLHWDSGIFLTLIVAITVGQAMENVLNRPELSVKQKMVAGPLLFFISIGLYGLVYNGVTGFLSAMPMVEQPLRLSVLQLVFGVSFLLGFFIMKLGIYEGFSWLYVRLVNDSQPYKNSVLRFKKSVK